jgi:hypothetical protein
MFYKQHTYVHINTKVASPGSILRILFVIHSPISTSPWICVIHKSSYQKHQHYMQTCITQDCNKKTTKCKASTSHQFELQTSVFSLGLSCLHSFLAFFQIFSKHFWWWVLFVLDKFCVRSKIWFRPSFVGTGRSESWVPKAQVHAADVHY